MSGIGIGGRDREQITRQVGLDAGDNLTRVKRLDAALFAARFLISTARMTRTWHDLRHGARGLMKSPGFSLVALFTLALGIGANTAIFSVVNAVLLRPLPLVEPSRLLVLDETSLTQSSGQRIGVSYPNFLAWRDRSRSFEAMAAHRYERVTYTSSDEPVRIPVAYVTADFFKVMRAVPLSGRTFLSEDDVPETPPIAVVSAAFAERRLGGTAGVVGRVLRIDGRDRTVVGVAPVGFTFPTEDTEVWLPLGPSANQASMKNRAVHLMNVIARLKEGVSQSEATAEMSTIRRGIQAQSPGEDPGHGEMVVSLHQAVVGDVQPSLLVLLGAVGFVLLIACVNVANLLLTRAAAREKEISIRAALGASRRRLVRQLFTESLLLAFLGAGLGTLLAGAANRWLVAQIAGFVPRASEIGIDASALGFAALTALITAALFGAVPALQSSRVDLNLALKESGATGTGGGRYGLRSLLVVAEVALSLILLVGAGLLIKSFWRLQQVDPGFHPTNLLTVSVSLPEAGYQEGRRATDFYEALPERLTALPGVVAASAVSRLPISGGDGYGNVTIDGRAFPRGEEPIASFRRNLPSYFKVMSIPLLRGREFDGRDQGTEKVVIINDSFARRYWPQGNAIGARIKVGPPEGEPWLTVVGVVGDVHNVGLDADPTLATYEPLAQRPRLSMNLVLRTATPPLETAAAVRAALRSLEKGILIADVSSFEERLERSVSPRRFNLLILTLFAGVALLLAVVGIYGVMSYALAQRTREIGIRMALGARGSDVIRQIAGEGFVLIGSGVLIGTVGALALTRSMNAMLFGVSATDPSTFAAISVLLTAVAILACLVPARRATKMDPVAALRQG